MSQPIPLPPFKAFLASNIPSVYDNTLSYYEELVKMIAYLEQVVVPAVNDTASQVDGIKKGLEDLKSYVDHYFDNLDVQEEINNKLDEMAEQGQLTTIVAAYLGLGAVIAYDTIADMAASEVLIDGCKCRCLSDTVAGTGDGAYYAVRTRVEADTPDGYSLVAIGDTLVAERIPNADVEELDDRIDGILTESDITVKSGYIFNNFYNMIKIPKAKIGLSLVMSDSYANGVYQYIKNLTNAIFANGPLHGPTINNGTVITASGDVDDIYLYFLGVDNNGDFKYTKDSTRSLTASDLASLGYNTVFPIFYPIVLGGVSFDYNTELPGLINDTAKHPRTIFGYDDTYVYIVAVEGRSQRSLGIAYADMAAFCQALGIANAFNLDGGGSTQIWLTNPAFNIVNQDSSSYGYGYSSRKVYGLIKLEINND